MPGQSRFEFRPRSGKFAKPTQLDPMRILVMGNFSGQQSANRPPISSRSLYNVNIDNLDEIMERIKPIVVLTPGAHDQSSLIVNGMDDFHPDHLYQTMNRFDELRALRKQLHRADSYQEAASRLQKLAIGVQPGTQGKPDASADDSPEQQAPEQDATTFERLLGESVTGTEAQNKKNNYPQSTAYWLMPFQIALCPKQTRGNKPILTR